MEICIKVLKNIIKKILFRIKLWRMDALWHVCGGSSYDLFPPSFYYTHTEEEIKCIKEKELASLRAMLEEYDAKYLTGDQKS